jgi:putative endonuclease
MYFVYAIYNTKINKIYIGQTQNIEIRLKLHNTKTFDKSYTGRLGGNWVLIYSEKCPDRTSALIREKQLKSYRGRQFVKQYIPR